VAQRELAKNDSPPDIVDASFVAPMDFS